MQAEDSYATIPNQTTDGTSNYHADDASDADCNVRNNGPQGAYTNHNYTTSTHSSH